MAEFRRLSEESVRQATSKGWEEWLGILDAWDARGKGHKLTARYLSDEYEVGGWWAQAVTIRWEWERGVRNAEGLIAPYRP